MRLHGADLEAEITSGPSPLAFRLERATLEATAAELTVLLARAKPKGDPRVERIEAGALLVTLDREVPFLGAVRLGVELEPVAASDGRLALALRSVTVDGAPLPLPASVVLKTLRSQVPEGHAGVARGTEGADVVLVDPRLVLAARGLRLAEVTSVHAHAGLLTLRLG